MSNGLEAGPAIGAGLKLEAEADDHAYSFKTEPL